MNNCCKTRRFAVVAVLACAVMPAADACSVPVFRWALERWPADSYELVIFHEKDVPEADLARIRAVEQRAQDMATPANLIVRRIDVTGPVDEPYAAIRRETQGIPLPACALLYPHAVHIAKPAWAGPLNEFAPDVLLDSPIRRELAKRLLDGQSGVWLFLASGNEAGDKAAMQVLAEEIGRANKTLRLPDLAGDEALEGPDAPDISNLRVEFSLLEADLHDPAEAMLVHMLLGSEPDLRDLNEAIAFPVYGRGRVLYALAGRGINAENIAKACAFLVGECACEIKAENPGVDLIMPVDWDKGIGDNAIADTVTLPPLPGTALPTAAGLGETAGCINCAKAVEARKKTFLRNGALTVAGAVILVAAGTAVMLFRRRSAP